MSVDIYVSGIVPSDTKKHKDMYAIYKMCKENKIDAPDEVYEYFSDREPCENSLEVDIPAECFIETKDKYNEYLIDLNKLKKICPNVTQLKIELG